LDFMCVCWLAACGLSFQSGDQHVCLTHLITAQTNKQTNTLWSFLGSKTSPFDFVDFVF
jgi:hypothetical protein